MDREWETRPLVVCVFKSKGTYSNKQGVEYVKRLRDSVPDTVDFVCFTDRPDLFVNVCDTITLIHNLHTWWSKLEIFRIRNRKCLYLDLDVIVHKDISFMFDTDTKFAILNGFMYNHLFNSSIMLWDGDFYGILITFLRTKETYIEVHSMLPMLGDQGYIFNYFGRYDIPDPDRLQELFPDKITSSKFNTLDEREKSSIVCYHGYPRPHDTGWAL